VAENIWQGLYERSRRRIDKHKQEVGGKFVSPPGVQALDEYEDQAGFKLPESYRQFVLLFGPCRVGYVENIACPGYPEEGSPIDLRARDEEFHAMYFDNVPEADLRDQYGDLDHFRRLVNFANFEERDWVWDPDDVTDPGNHEYGIYLVGRIQGLDRVARSFREFVRLQLRKYKEDGGSRYVAPICPARIFKRRRRK
jgi:hypothetical protein